MKFLKATALSLLAATPSFAGGLSEPAMEPEVIEEEAANDSRAGIIVPIMALIMFGLAMSGGSDSPGEVLPTDR